ncbi:MAG: helix-turn-helix transcriptional regulator [Mycobacterium sp.]|uniref:helix-turn-helix transcriptional regulator n=1 Tax=Mycobacterium sp. TaxID=1785 RepID=UPI00389A47AD
MVAIEEFSHLVALIYATATAPQQWESAIRAIQSSLGGSAGSLLTGGGAGWAVQGATLPADALESYERYYHQLDYALATVQAGPFGVVRTGLEIMVPNRNEEFYAGWMRPNELEDGFFVRLSDGVRPACFVICTSDGSGSFDDPERIKVMSGLVVHLQQALRTQNQLTALATQNVALAGALEAVRHGIVIVGPECTVLNLNSAAETILRAEDGLHHRHGRITATGMRTDQELRRAVHCALADGTTDVPTGQAFTCVRPSGKRPYVIHLLPLPCDEANETSRGPAALVLIIDPERENDSATTLLRRLHGLTATEAEVAIRISRGTSLKQVSDELSVSYQTIRTHLQHVYDKTDTHRQGELVRLLLAHRP